MKFLDSEILYLDNHIICVDKPPLLLTQPTNLVQDSVETRAKQYIKEKYQKPGNVFLHPVHRLDRVASGIVVCARTSKALTRLNAAIRSGDWVKKYTLHYENTLPHDAGELIHFLKREEYKTVAFDKESPGTQKALLRYKKVGNQLAEVSLITGRYHQIRAQFSKIGCPIWGDSKYGSTKKAISPGIDLHHSYLAFKHPVTKEEIVLQSYPVF